MADTPVSGWEIFKMADEAQHGEVGGRRCPLLTQVGVSHSMAHSYDGQTGTHPRAWSQGPPFPRVFVQCCSGS